MSLAEFITQYGALAVFIGAGAEGETAAFLGGIFAHRHLMPDWQAAAAASLGSFAADQLFFFAGRYASRLGFVRKFIASKMMKRVAHLLETYPTGFILSFRFIYGIRIISPVAIGLSSISPWRFLLLNFIAAALWGTVITAVGYLLGNAVEALFGRLRLHHHLLVALAAILLVIAFAAIIGRKYLSKASQGA
ncbi:DedA family protein [Rhizobium puerariae]|uniref:DedA family protein n=1 Tax=Rhizobium puerariae TaxID=1585791 RepID=A0ABV6AKS4_9HYPH